MTYLQDREFLHSVGCPPDDCNCPWCWGEPPDCTPPEELLAAEETFEVRCDLCQHWTCCVQGELGWLQESSPLAPCGCLWKDVTVSRQEW